MKKRKFLLRFYLIKPNITPEKIKNLTQSNWKGLTNDPFVAHMDLVHEGKLDDAINEKYAKHKFKFMTKLHKRLNR